MADAEMRIRPYLTADENAVAELWRKCNLARSWNNPALDIERKLEVNPKLFLVGLIDDTVVATVIGGYDGHRGWVYYLAVDPVYQRKGYGTQIMKVIGEKLRAMGCPKINLQVRTDNIDVVKFYESIGYKTEERISMGKRLVEDESF
ncbi:GNAT family acetyltransferase [Chloroflexota bacterium]